MKEFERNGLNLTATKREEVQRLTAQIDELSFQYVQNLNDDSTSVLFHENELAGLPAEFLKVLHFLYLISSPVLTLLVYIWKIWTLHLSHLNKKF